MRLERIQEHLDAFRRAAALRWTRLTPADLADVEADTDNLGDVVARRYSLSTAAGRAEAAEFFADFGTSLGEAAEVVGDAARDLWRNGRHHVVEAVHIGTDKVQGAWQRGSSKLRTWCDRTEAWVERRPFLALGAAFGFGAMLGSVFARK